VIKKDAFGDKSIRVPFFQPYISKNDKIAVTDALGATLLTDGPILQKFERVFSIFTKSKFGIGVSNATSALHLSLKALGIGRGDEVIVPDMTFVATANAVLISGATPILADVDDDMNLSVTSVEQSLTRKTKAIIPVHFAGKVCDIKRLKRIARTNQLALIEDCAHAIGAKLDGQHVGTFGDVGCFSFYPTKNITTIEGGMITTQSKNITESLKSLRNHGITKSLVQRYSKGTPWDYDVIEPGYNYRLDEVRSALGINQLKHIKKLNSLRRKAYEYYNEKLSDVLGIVTPKLSKYENHACHLYIIRVQKEYGISRNQLFKELLSHGIRTSVHYKPLHQFTIFKKRAKIMDSIKNSKNIYRQIISLPLYPTITPKQQDYVTESIRNISSTR
jgi:dTDP-4-amino-4,6-dideoxygalactose transaminase